ncbi:hypothetical protein GCM10020000_83910 [Streptomyces olivoverticillatus]
MLRPARSSWWWPPSGSPPAAQAASHSAATKAAPRDSAQQIHDNARQILELTQLAKLVLVQIQQNQYGQIQF